MSRRKCRIRIWLSRTQFLEVMGLQSQSFATLDILVMPQRPAYIRDFSALLPALVSKCTSVFRQFCNDMNRVNPIILLHVHTSARPRCCWLNYTLYFYCQRMHAHRHKWTILITLLTTPYLGLSVPHSPLHAIKAMKAAGLLFVSPMEHLMCQAAP